MSNGRQQDREHEGGASGHSRAGDGAGSPGKRTLTDNLQRRLAPVQGAEVPASDAGLHEAAARGASGPGAALPYLDTIQQSFGRFALGDVRAHTGPAATEAAGAIGAEAYATGSDVVFAGPPSLHTAAHEAAHVVQQRGGVQLKGGVGAEGDAYERHADAVADRVVAGQSAEGLLASHAGGGGDTALQLSVDLHKANVNGAKGARNVYKDSADDKLYAKLPSSTAATWQMIEVTLVVEATVEKYKEVEGAAKRPWTVATSTWADLAPAVEAEPEAPAEPTGWTLGQITSAGFKKKSGNHYQLDQSDYLGYHVHVSAYREDNGEFTSFHVKFDTRVADYLSWFYSYASGGRYDHPGQSEFKQKQTIKTFAQSRDEAHAVPSKATVDGIYDDLVARSEDIAAVVRGKL